MPLSQYLHLPQCPLGNAYGFSHVAVDHSSEKNEKTYLRHREARAVARLHPPPGRAPGNTTSTYELRQAKSGLDLR